MSGVLTKNIFLDGNAVGIQRGVGCYVYDGNEKKYLDFSSQTLNMNLGHSHPEIILAVKKQLNKYYFASSRFYSETFVRLAEKLIAISPREYTKINVKLTNGSDANESAFKRVRKLTGRKYIGSLQASHLGETSETISACGKHFDNRKYIGGSQNFIFFPPPHPHFCPTCNTKKIAEEYSLSEVKKILTRDSLAAIVIEPVMVNAGVYILSESYLAELRSLCDNYEVALIFDEVQTAFGWTGDYFFTSGIQTRPDLITLGKGLAAGFPLAAILMKEDYDVLDYGEDEFTSGGHPLSCAAALKNIEILERIFESHQLNHTELTLKTALENLQMKHPNITEIRGTGLIWAIDFRGGGLEGRVNEIYETCLRNGVILRKTQDGNGTALVIKPPVIIDDHEIESGIKIIDMTIGEFEK